MRNTNTNTDHFHEPLHYVRIASASFKLLAAIQREHPAIVNYLTKRSN